MHMFTCVMMVIPPSPHWKNIWQKIPQWNSGKIYPYPSWTKSYLPKMVMMVIFATELAKIADHVGQAKADMDYIQKHYITKSNYARVNGAPLLLDFGPQTLHGNEWDQAFAPFTQKPTFLILADKDLSAAGNSAKGGFAWVWPDYLDGLKRIYSKNVPVKFGVAYPGFNAFYKVTTLIFSYIYTRGVQGSIAKRPPWKFFYYS